MIDWAGCTTVMIGRPSPKTFPSILNICVRLVDVGAAGECSAGLRARVRYPKECLVKCRLRGSEFPLGRKKNLCNSRRIKFRRATAGKTGCLRARTELTWQQARIDESDRI